MDKPILWSFRRCPYAMRARMALIVSEIDVEHREILLKDKPAEFRATSPTATVPALKLPDGTVLDESLDIMHWALGQNDPGDWLIKDPALADDAAALIEQCDGPFKRALDQYKYADRHPESPEHYREQAMSFLNALNTKLSGQNSLLGLDGDSFKKSVPATGDTNISNRLTIADIAIFPFIRQFAAVDRDWFNHHAGPAINRWLNTLLEWPLFRTAMEKHPLYQAPANDKLA